LNLIFSQFETLIIIFRVEIVETKPFRLLAYGHERCQVYARHVIFKVLLRRNFVINPRGDPGGFSALSSIKMTSMFLSAPLDVMQIAPQKLKWLENLWKIQIHHHFRRQVGCRGDGARCML
jgi:hypothetical protein